MGPGIARCLLAGLLLMAIKVGTFQASSGGVSGLPFAPKLVIVFSAMLDGFGSPFVGEQYMTIGYARGTGGVNQRSLELASGWDSLAFFKPHARTAARLGEVISDITLNLATINLGGLTLTADGFSIAYSQLNNGNLDYGYIAIGGDGVSVVFGTGTTPGSTGEVETTGLGITPDLLLFCSGYTGNSGDGVWWSQGFVDTAGRQRVSAVHSYGDRSSTAPPGDTDRYNSESECIAMLNEVNGAKMGAAEFVSKEDGAFTLDWTQVPGFTADYFYIAVEGVAAQLGTVVQSPTASVEQIDGLEVEPEAVLFQSVQLTQAQAGAVQDALRVAIGVGQPGANYAVFAGDADAVPAFNLLENVRAQRNDAAIELLNGATTVARAAVTDLGESPGIGGFFELTWASTDGVARDVYWLAIGVPASTTPDDEEEPEDNDPHFDLPGALAGHEGPIVAVELHHPELADPLVIAPIELADPVAWHYGYKSSRLIRIDQVQLALSDRGGRPQANRFRFEMSDYVNGDSAPIVRSWLGQVNKRAVRRIEIVAWMIRDIDRRRLREPFIIFRGRVDEVHGNDEFTVAFDCRSWGYQRYDQPVLTTKIGDIFQNAPSDTLQRVAPLALGRLTDEGSDEAAPVIVEDEDGRGSAVTPEPLAGYGDLAVAAPTGVTASEASGAGEIDLGLVPGNAFRIFWTRVVGGIEGQPSAFLPADGAAVVIAGNDAAIDTACDDDGADAYRAYLCHQTTSGEWVASQYIETDDPEAGVQFTHEPPIDSALPITPGAVPAINPYAYAVVAAIMPDGRTEASEVVFVRSVGYKRPNRFAWTPIPDAEYYEVFWRDLPTGWPFTRKFIVPVEQLNDDGDNYWEYDWSLSGFTVVPGMPVPIGKVPPVYCGKFTDSEGFSEWGGFMLSVRPGGEFLAARIGGVLFDEGMYGNDIAAPGKTGYSTLFGADPFRTVGDFRVFMVYLRGPALEAALDPTTAYGSFEGEFRCSFEGCEDDDDGTGDVITDKFDQLLLLLKHLLLKDTPSVGGAWPGTVPTFFDGHPRINSASFVRAKLDHQAMVPAGRRAAKWIATSITWGAMIGEWSLSAGAKTGIDEDGAFIVAVRNPYAMPVATVDSKYEVIRRTFRFSDTARGFATRTPFAYEPQYDASGSFALLNADERRAAARAAEYDEDPKDDEQQYAWIDSAAAARQLANASLVATQHPPRSVQSMSVLHWLHFPMGRAIRITHPEGPKAAGYQQDKLQILGKTIDPHACTVALMCDDLRKGQLDVSIFVLEEYMATIWVGGSRVDSTEEVDTNVVRPLNGFRFKVDWDAMPETHGIRLIVEVATTVGNIKPAVYADGDLPPDPVVVEGVNENADDMENQAQTLEIERPEDAGEKDYVVYGILSGGAAAADCRMHAIREAYQL